MTWLDDLNAWCARWTRHALFLPAVFALSVLNFILAVLMALTDGPDWLWVLPTIGGLVGLQLLFWWGKPR